MRLTAWLFTCSLTLGLGACSGIFGSDDAKQSKEGALPGSGPGSDAGSENSGVPSSGTSANGALKIINLSSTSPVVTGGLPAPTETDTVTFSAIVTSTKGLDFIAGGQLLDESGKTYAPFSSGSTKGTYATALTWQQINQGHSIDFATGDGANRKFVAKFFDNDGNEVTASVTLSLQCRLNPTQLVGACGGGCVESLANSGNDCGACGSRCPAGAYCSGSTCKTPSKANVGACLSASQVAGGTTCTDLCNQVGSACFEGRMYDAAACGTSSFYGLGCSTSPRDFITTSPFFRCICSQ